MPGFQEAEVGDGGTRLPRPPGEGTGCRSNGTSNRMSRLAVGAEGNAGLGAGLPSRIYQSIV
jgi:hypothetical protein